MNTMKIIASTLLVATIGFASIGSAAQARSMGPSLMSMKSQNGGVVGPHYNTGNGGVVGPNHKTNGGGSLGTVHKVDPGLGIAGGSLRSGVEALGDRPYPGKNRGQSMPSTGPNRHCAPYVHGYWCRGTPVAEAKKLHCYYLPTMANGSVTGLEKVCNWY